MDDVARRLECLRLAVLADQDTDGASVLAVASMFDDWVRGDLDLGDESEDAVEEDGDEDVIIHITRVA